MTAIIFRTAQSTIELENLLVDPLTIAPSFVRSPEIHYPVNKQSGHQLALAVAGSEV
jgi:hypothetical protein